MEDYNALGHIHITAQLRSQILHLKEYINLLIAKKLKLVNTTSKHIDELRSLLKGDLSNPSIIPQSPQIESNEDTDDKTVSDATAIDPIMYDEEKFNCLVYGYIRENSNIINVQIPTDIYQFCFIWYYQEISIDDCRQQIEFMQNWVYDLERSKIEFLITASRQMDELRALLTLKYKTVELQ